MFAQAKSGMEASAPPSNGRVFGDEKIGDEWPSPIGLFSGIFAVAVAQVLSHPANRAPIALNGELFF